MALLLSHEPTSCCLEFRRTYNRETRLVQGRSGALDQAQGEDGSWDDPTSPGHLTDTCFAILFLARETVMEILPWNPFDSPDEESEKEDEESEFFREK